MKNAGGCLCGVVRFVTTGEPAKTMACHCTTCKLRTGAAYGLGVYFEESAVEILQGELATHEFNSDTTGRWIRTEFCTKCGSAVTWTAEMRPGWRAIAGGSYDNPDWFSLEAHIWTRSARSDMRYPENMHCCEEAFVNA